MKIYLCISMIDTHLLLFPIFELFWFFFQILEPKFFQESKPKLRFGKLHFKNLTVLSEFNIKFAPGPKFL